VILLLKPTVVSRIPPNNPREEEQGYQIEERFNDPDRFGIPPQAESSV
jgi:hypothetical protein